MSDGILRENLASRLEGLLGSMMFDREIDPSRFIQKEPQWKYFIREVSRLEEYGHAMAELRSKQVEETDHWRRKYWLLRGRMETVLEASLND